MPWFKEMKQKLPFGKKKRDESEKEKKKKKKDRKNKSNAGERESMMVMEQVEEEHPLETLSQKLLRREEQMMTSGDLSEEDQSQLSQDLDQLWSEIQLAVQNTFSPSFRGEALRAALRCVQQQEDMDQRWSSLDSGLVPVWRPMRALQKHDELLENMVQAQLAQRPPQDEAKTQFKVKEADEQDGPEAQRGSDQDSVDVTREVRCMSEQMRQDLLHIERTVSLCYPEHMDILNTYVKLYHRCFSSRLEQLAASSLDGSALGCLLDCVRHGYRNILMELENKVDIDSLGPLLPSDVLQRLQEDFLNIKQDKIQEWLQRALELEEKSWEETFRQPQDISYCHSPLASDVLPMLNLFLSSMSSRGLDQGGQTVSALLVSFLSRYVKAVVEFVEGNHSNVPSVLKAQLVCEEQFRDFVLKQDMDEKKRESCLESLDALRDCGYCSLTSGIRSRLKRRPLWTPGTLWPHVGRFNAPATPRQMLRHAASNALNAPQVF